LPSSTRVRLSLFTASSFATLGVHLPFWPAWLEARGMSTVQIGTLTMAWAWTRGLTLPVWAHFADLSGRRKPWVIALAWLSLLAFSPFTFAREFEGLLALTIVFAAFYSAVHPLAENVVLLATREGKLSYGSVRMWGSISFLVVSRCAGDVLDGGHEERAYSLVLAALAFTAIVAFALPDVAAAPAVRRAKMPIREVLSHKPLLAALVGSGVLQASHAVYYVFSTLHWSAAGHSKSTVGTLWAEGVVAEVLLIYLASPLLRRFGDVKLMAIAVLGGAIRWTVLGTTTDLAALAAVQWLHALSFAAAHVATMGYIARAVPADRSATATSLYGTFNIAAHALTILAITPVFDAYGGSAFLPMIGVAALGGALAAHGMRRTAPAVP
jgi:MFS transporter, PPP family, 3-phenylpropionic acid transporter